MKKSLLLTAVFLSIVIYANINEMHGISGLTKRDGGIGCVCHNISPNDSVIVWIEGPDSVRLNDTASYTLYLTGGPLIKGGLDVAAYSGILDSADTSTHILDGEITHTNPKPFVNDTVSWKFFYIAPDSMLTDTIYSVSNSVNGDSIPSELDKWNFGENFVVHVTDNPTNLNNNTIQPEEFVLGQNYPNPFNPGTVINYRLSVTSKVSLKVYDILGNEIKTLVNEEKPAGTFEITFNASELTSGIYFYRLVAGNIVATKKMVLIK